MTTRGFLAAACAALLLPLAAYAQTYDTGASATEVKLGQSGPYSGPASAYAIILRTQVAYFQMINDKGGINGRKINLLSVDDGYNPAKAVEANRRLIEQDQVFAIFCTLGTPSTSATQAYLNRNGVPQIIYSGASRFSDPAQYPWTLSIYPSYQLEGMMFARYILKNKPDAKIGVLYQHDDFGGDYLVGLKKGLGAKAATMIVRELSYEVTDTDVATQIIELKGAGADTMVNFSSPRFAAQAIRAMADRQWKPLHLLTSVSSSLATVLQPAGAANATGLITAVFMKTAGEPQWANDADIKEYEAFVKKYMPEAKPGDFNISIAYLTSSIMADMLRKAGDNLTRKNLMKVATSMAASHYPLLLPGITYSTAANNYEGYNTMRLQRFDGTRYVLLDQ